MVEVRQGTLVVDGGGGGGGGRQATNIKSNNPHLAGGEKICMVGISANEKIGSLATESEDLRIL